MRQLQVFVLRDDKAAMFLQPFCSLNASTATRDMATLANDPSHQFGAHPMDYHLFHVGYFDHDTGLVISEAAPVLVTSLLSLVERRPSLPLEAEVERLVQKEPQAL